MKLTLADYSAPQLLVVGVTAILLLSFGTAAALAWGLDAPARSSAVLTDVNPQEGHEVGKQVTEKCAECGVVESMQMIIQGDEKPRANKGPYEITNTPGRTSEVSVTVRMSNGTSRLFTDASLVRWRPGERVIFIGGATR